jgi:hypothetical protein
MKSGSIFAAICLAHVAFASGPELAPLPQIHRMRRVAVASEAISSLGYHRKTQILEIRFRSGEIYRYRPVTPGLFGEFCAAPSKGKFFQTKIRGRYRFWKVDY